MTITLKPDTEASPAYRDDATGEDVYVVHRTYGSVELRVPADTVVHQRDSRGYERRAVTDPTHDQHFPNMEVREGCLVIPVDDVVQQIVARSDPADLAKALWADEAVRDEFTYCLKERYSQGHVTDADRRKFLTKVQSAVHSAALDLAVQRLGSIEYDQRQRAQVRLYDRRYQANYESVLETIQLALGSEARSVIESRCGKAYVVPEGNPKDFEIGGKYWTEDHERWRAELTAMFAPPQSQEETVRVTVTVTVTEATQAAEFFESAPVEHVLIASEETKP